MVRYRLSQKYRGVIWDPEVGKWRVRIKRTAQNLPNGWHSLSRVWFDSELDAALFYDRAVKRTRHKPNFPEPGV